MSPGDELPELPAPSAGTAPRDLLGDVELASMMRAIPVRVGAELGRARMPLGAAVDLGPGVVIELDRDADDPVELTINGQPFATGQLLQIDGGEWAVRIERVLDVVLPGAVATPPPAAPPA
jgi:flagellar motor switch protein FliN/FliY